MLRLVGVLLSCGALCLAVPVLPTPGTGCADSSLIQEALVDIETLKPKDGSKIMPLNNVMEVEGNVTTDLEAFIKALQSSNRPEETQIALKLQKIGTLCLGLTKEDWKPDKEMDFFDNLECLLRSMKHNATSEESE